MALNLLETGVSASYGMSGSMDILFYTKGADMEGLPLPSVTYDVDAYVGPRRDWPANVAAMANWIAHVLLKHGTW